MKLRGIAAALLILLVIAGAVFLPGLLIHRQQNQLLSKTGTAEGGEYTFDLSGNSGELPENPDQKALQDAINTADDLPTRLAKIGVDYSGMFVGDLVQATWSGNEDAFGAALEELHGWEILTDTQFETNLTDLKNGNYTVTAYCFIANESLTSERKTLDMFNLYLVNLGTSDVFTFDATSGKIIGVQLADFPEDKDPDYIFESMGLYLGMEVQSVFDQGDNILGENVYEITYIRRGSEDGMPIYFQYIGSGPGTSWLFRLGSY